MSKLLVKDLCCSDLFGDELRILAGKNALSNKITLPYVQIQGLSLAGYTEFLAKEQVNIWGKEGLSYLKRLPEELREPNLQKYFDFGVACCIITWNQSVPKDVIRHAKRTNTPVMKIEIPTHVFVERVTKFLEAKLSPTTTVHGVMMDVHGVGIMIKGESGIGKSECALDLVLKGHRLVSDDVVKLRRIPPGIIRAESTDIVKYHMEIRGMGIINVKELFGITSIRNQKKVHLVVRLVPWEQTTEYERVGLEEEMYDILGSKIPMITLPVAPGRNISAVIEAAAKNQLLKLEGFNSAEEFEKQLIRRIEEKKDSEFLEEPE